MHHRGDCPTATCEFRACLLGVQGSVCTIIATTLAASLAFSLSQGVGRRFAERMVDSEVKEGSDGGNAIKRALGNVQESIDKGSFWQQFSAVLALRMTPVVPFRCGRIGVTEAVCFACTCQLTSACMLSCAVRVLIFSDSLRCPSSPSSAARWRP